MKRYSCDSFHSEEEEKEGLREVSMMEPTKRSPCSTIEQSSTLTSLVPKRHKPDLSISSKDRKDKIGEKIVALQQIVSPYGKTDTASVLLETSEYIRFLHEQVQVLSAPYLESIPASSKMQGLETMYSLRNRGLCLVPISCTVGIARTNGADIWAPIKSSSSISPRPDNKPLSHYFN